VELPLAADVILAGIRTAAVLCIGITTIASFIGAGGLGELIQNGLRTNDNAVTLAGAIPAAVLALGVDGLLGLWQNWLRSRRTGTMQSSVQSGLPWVASGVAACLILGLWVMPNLAANQPAATASTKPFRVASKEFTESRVLAEILVLAAKSKGINAVRAPELGGNLCHQALLAGKADAYPEYTGTAYADILKLPVKTDAVAVYNAAAAEYPKRFHLRLSPPLGFSNGFAMLVRSEDAKRLHLRSLSDAVPYAPQWKAAFGPDFITRADGWPGLSKAYGLRLQTAPLSLDLGLLNRALASKQVDLIAGNETDGTIPSLGLFELQDDRQYFPPYQGVFVVREAALAEQPKLKAVLAGLKNAISTADMQKMNYEVDGRKRSPEEVAAEWWSKAGVKEH
jgi:osmoprotectant transport system permease protein